MVSGQTDPFKTLQTILKQGCPHIYKKKKVLESHNKLMKIQDRKRSMSWSFASFEPRNDPLKS